MLQVLQHPESEYAIRSSNFSICILNADKLYDTLNLNMQLSVPKSELNSFWGEFCFVCFLIGWLFLFIYFRSKVASLWYARHGWLRFKS